MTDSQRELRREYLRDWRAANPEKEREYQRRYRAANAEKVSEYQRAYWRCYYSVNAERLREYQRHYQAANPERELERRRRRMRFTPAGRILTFSKAVGPLRAGTCSACGRVGLTHLHHERYDPDNPLAHTIELCPRCHGRRQKRATSSPQGGRR